MLSKLMAMILSYPLLGRPMVMRGCWFTSAEMLNIQESFSFQITMYCPASLSKLGLDEPPRQLCTIFTENGKMESPEKALKLPRSNTFTSTLLHGRSCSTLTVTLLPLETTTSVLSPGMIKTTITRIYQILFRTFFLMNLATRL